MASSLFLSSKSRGLRAESQTRTRTKTRTMIILTHKKCPGKWANGDGGVRRPLMRHIFMYLEVILSHPVRPPPLTSLTYKYYIFQRVIHGIKGKCLSVVRKQGPPENTQSAQSAQSKHRVTQSEHRVNLGLYLEHRVNTE